MPDSHRYAMLLSALPYHGPLFGAKQTPLSRFRLHQRLVQLDPTDASDITILGQLLDWTHQNPSRSDEQAMTEAKRQVAEIANPFARDLAVWRLELRTLIAALRRRRRGDLAPEDNRWGYGRWTDTIRRNWTESAFGLQGVFPWLPEGARMIALGDALGLERLLLQTVWNHLEGISGGHHFDFEAVVVYVMRWDLIARWTSYQDEGGLDRFDALVANAMADVNLERMIETQIA
ncbi:DUF2764 family protein [Thiorhodococcus fuscus]|uniref:DUF2764 family protein n=1 Tax=Thiorhodococcus fuscus TaxID=527200 RepID=A0ABW4Y5C5_9GAMM